QEYLGRLGMRTSVSRPASGDTSATLGDAISMSPVSHRTSTSPGSHTPVSLPAETHPRSAAPLEAVQGEGDLERARRPLETLHLMACMEKGPYRVELHQVTLSDVVNDKSLFNRLRGSYRGHIGVFRPLWSLRTVRSIDFIK